MEHQMLRPDRAINRVKKRGAGPGREWGGGTPLLGRHMVGGVTPFWKKSVRGVGGSPPFPIRIYWEPGSPVSFRLDIIGLRGFASNHKMQLMILHKTERYSL